MLVCEGLVDMKGQMCVPVANVRSVTDTKS